MVDEEDAEAVAVPLAEDDSWPSFGLIFTIYSAHFSQPSLFGVSLEKIIV